MLPSPYCRFRPAEIPEWIHWRREEIAARAKIRKSLPVVLRDDQRMLGRLQTLRKCKWPAVHRSLLVHRLQMRGCELCLGMRVGSLYELYAL